MATVRRCNYEQISVIGDEWSTLAFAIVNVSARMRPRWRGARVVLCLPPLQSLVDVDDYNR